MIITRVYIHVIKVVVIEKSVSLSAYYIVFSKKLPFDDDTDD